MGAGASSTKLPRAPLKDFALLKPRNYHGIKVTEGYDDEVDREDEVPPPLHHPANRAKSFRVARSQRDVAAFSAAYNSCLAAARR